MISLNKVAENTPWVKPEPINTWGYMESLKDFMANGVEIPDSMASDLIYPGSVTTIAAPASTGKTVVLYVLENEIGRGGIFRGEKLTPARILHLDYDNPKGIVQKRIKEIFKDYDVDMQIMSRDHSPQLLDKKAWRQFPVGQHDLVVIDSFGSAAIGVSEKEGAKLQQALDTLKMIADKGAAVVVLENTDKTGTNYRGRGEKLERADIFYEARDVTNWTPPKGIGWWEHLPNGGDADWQARASRRKEQAQIRIALVCRKFRWGEEPAPFVLQVDFSTAPVTLTDVTIEIENMGREASRAARDEKQRALTEAAIALSDKIRTLGADREPISKTDAETFLMGEGLTRREARNLLDSYNAEMYPSEGRWRLRQIPHARGKKMGVFPLLYG